MGYCSSSAAVARAIKEFIANELHLSVLDWATDFDPATSILQQIEEASRRCGAGIFLFTKDDALSDGHTQDRAVPRDNVVFEARYFSALKGKAKVLIVRESGGQRTLRPSSPSSGGMRTPRAKQDQAQGDTLTCQRQIRAGSSAAV